MNRRLPNKPWSKWIKRVILHVPHYLSYDGEITAGGRQRKVRDIARILQNKLEVETVVAQKATYDWTRHDDDGTRILGIKSRLDVYGDPLFGWRTAQLVKGDEDAIIYLGGEDAWPFFVENAKGYHVGVWWDGPNSNLSKYLTGVRTQAFFRKCRAVACCDTNVINWLRTRDRRYQDAANRAIYIPNAVDLDALPPIQHRVPHKPLRIIFARRFELKRGPYLMLDAAQILKQKGFPFELTMSSAVGHDGSDTIRIEAELRGISENVVSVSNTMNSILSLYKSADISVVPTLWSEGTSYSAVEALAAGLPTVTTTVGGLPNLVYPNYNGFVCEPKPEAIAAAILQYADDKIWRQHHENALSMRESFSMIHWEKRVTDWLLS